MSTYYTLKHTKLAKQTVFTSHAAAILDLVQTVFMNLKFKIAKMTKCAAADIV